MRVLKRRVRMFDFSIIVVLLGLVAYSCLALLSATHGKPVTVTHLSHPVLKQMIYEALGFVALAVCTWLDYRTLRKYVWWIYGVCVFLLIAVYGFSEINYSHSWIHFAGLSVQPSEFAKLALILATAHYMASIDEQEIPDYRLRKVLPIFGMLIVPFLLTYKEPALGQALVMFAITMTMYVIFARRSQFLILTAAFIGLVGFIAIVAVQYPVQSTHAIEALTKVKIGKHHIVQAFQTYRIITWLNPNFSLSNWGYNVHQAQLAVGSGQMFGEGLFNGILSRQPYGIPNQWTDYIFTAIAEEFGFVASSGLIVLFLILVYRMVKVASSAQDTFGTYVVMGIVGMFSFQLFENIGMNMYLSPSTGITLPFISYGGTSLIANYMAVGIVLSAAVRRKKLRFS